MQLHGAREQFTAAGARLVLIGQGGARQAAHFRRRMGVEGVLVLADADRASYRAAGARRGGVGELLGPKSVVSGVKHAARSRVIQGRPVGDVTQLGGAMIVRPGGAVAFWRMAEHAGDSVEPRELLEVVAAGA